MATTPINFNQELFCEFSALDDFWEECGLFFSGRTGCRWIKRYQDWEKHLQGYEKLKTPPVVPPPSTGPPGTDRIDKLSKLLDILDIKIGMALTFNVVLLTGVSIFLPWIPTVVEQSKCIGVRTFFSGALNVLTFAILFLLLVSLSVLLRGFRRLVWGDLARPEPDLNKKEEKHAGFMIISVARRTNHFRISTYITSLAHLLLVLLVVTGAAFAIARNMCADIPESGRDAISSPPLARKITIENNSGFVQFGGIASSPTLSTNQTNPLPASGTVQTCRNPGTAHTCRPKKKHTCECSSADAKQNRERADRPPQIEK